MQQLKKESAHLAPVGATIETNAGGANFYPQYTRLRELHNPLWVVR